MKHGAVLDSRFNLTRINLISLTGFNAIQNDFFVDLVVAYFFGPLCMFVGMSHDRCFVCLRMLLATIRV